MEEIGLIGDSNKMLVLESGSQKDLAASKFLRHEWEIYILF